MAEVHGNVRAQKNGAAACAGKIRVLGKRLLVTAVWAVAAVALTWGMHKATESDAHSVPSYKKISIEGLLKTDWGPEEYRTLFLQTGLGAAAVDHLKAKGRTEELLDYQERFFAVQEVECEAGTPITRQERIRGTKETATGARGIGEELQVIPYVEKGDILITFNCHFGGWRNGHAALVVDGEGRKTLEAQELGKDTVIVSMDYWEHFPSFAVLRLKGADSAQREEIADLAAKQLLGIPYGLEAGVAERLGMDTSGISTTQCAHLVWYAFNRFGYDLDSDGGILVTPRDLYESPLLEVVQIFGCSGPAEKGS